MQFYLTVRMTFILKTKPDRTAVTPKFEGGGREITFKKFPKTFYEVFGHENRNLKGGKRNHH
jgi:hypothetical protein